MTKYKKQPDIPVLDTFFPPLPGPENQVSELKLLTDIKQLLQENNTLARIVLQEQQNNRKLLEELLNR